MTAVEPVLPAAGEPAWRRFMPWIEGGTLAFVVLLILAMGSEAVRASYHGYLHTTLGNSVLREGLTPENPYHAGVPLKYYTLYPLLGVLIGKISFGPLWGFVIMNVLAALLMGPAMDSLGRAFGLKFANRRVAFLAVVIGFNAIGWIGFITADRHEFGKPPMFVLRGMTFVREFHGIGWDTRLQAFLPKFLNVSSFAIAIPFGLLAMAEAMRAGTSEERSPWRALPFAALALALNPLVGAFAGLAMAVGIAPTLLKGSMQQRLRWPIVGVLAVGLAFPFLMALFQPAPEGENILQLGPNFGNVVSNYFGPQLLLWIPAILGWRRMTGPARWKYAAFFGVLTVIALFVPLPWGNEYKFSRLAGIYLAIPAGMYLGDLLFNRARAWIPIGLGLIAAPTFGLTVAAYVAWGAGDVPVPLKTEGRELVIDVDQVRDPIPQAILDAEAAYDPAAAFLAHPAAPGMAVAGGLVQGHPLSPLLHRPLVSDQPHFHNDGNPDLMPRFRASWAIWSEMTPDTARFPAQRMSREKAMQYLRSRLPDREFLFLSPVAPEIVGFMKRIDATMVKRAGGYGLWSIPPLSQSGGS